MGLSPTAAKPRTGPGTGAVIAPAAVTDLDSLKFRSAADACRLAARPLP